MSKKIILFGEYLLRLSPPGNKKLLQAESLDMHWAGSEANIAVSLSILGKQVHYVTAMPSNQLAQVGITQLQRYGVPTTIIEKPNSRTGIYFYESGQGARPGRVIYDRDYSAFSMLQSNDIDWDHIFVDAGLFHWSGITPALNANLVQVCTEALHAAKKNGLIVSGDFNYRSTLWKYGKDCSAVMPTLLQQCDIILADADSAKLYFGITSNENELVKNTCAQLKKKLPNVKYIAMTMRSQHNATSNGYTGYLWHNGIILSSREYCINSIAERVGTGDAFMAGLIFGLHNQQPLQQVIEFATACGVMKHSIMGDFNLASIEEIEIIIQQKGSGRIIR